MSGRSPSEGKAAGTSSPSSHPLLARRRPRRPRSCPRESASDPSSTSRLATCSIVAGSIAVTKSVSPSTRNPFWRNAESTATSSSAPTLAATSVENGVNEVVDRLRSARSVALSATSSDAFSDAAKIATIATRPEPDHQRRCGRRRPPRVPHRVLAPDLARDAPPPERAADHAGDRARDHRGAGSRCRRTSAPRRARRAARRCPWTRTARRRAPPRPPVAIAAPIAIRRPSATVPPERVVLAERLDGGDPRGVPGRHDRRDDRDPDPHHERRDDRPRAGSASTSWAGRCRTRRARPGAAWRCRRPRGPRPPTRAARPRAPRRPRRPSPGVGWHRGCGTAPARGFAAPR